MKKISSYADDVRASLNDYAKTYRAVRSMLPGMAYVFPVFPLTFVASSAISIAYHSPEGMLVAAFSGVCTKNAITTMRRARRAYDTMQRVVEVAGLQAALCLTDNGGLNRVALRAYARDNRLKEEFDEFDAEVALNDASRKLYRMSRELEFITRESESLQVDQGVV